VLDYKAREKDDTTVDLRLGKAGKPFGSLSTIVSRQPRLRVRRVRMEPIDGG
jgi:hypothetical protein